MFSVQMECSSPSETVVYRILPAATVFQVPSAPTSLFVRRCPEQLARRKSALPGLLAEGEQHILNFEQA